MVRFGLFVIMKTMLSATVTAICIETHSAGSSMRACNASGIASVDASAAARWMAFSRRPTTSMPKIIMITIAAMETSTHVVNILQAIAVM